jgi:hypothetical protein
VLVSLDRILQREAKREIEKKRDAMQSCAKKTKGSRVEQDVKHVVMCTYIHISNASPSLLSL